MNTIVLYINNGFHGLHRCLSAKRLAIALLFLISHLSCGSLAAQQVISLAGAWDFLQGDPKDYSGGVPTDYDDYVMLPGSMLTNGKGEPVSVRTQWTGSLYDSSFYFNPYMEKYRKEQPAVDGQQESNVKFPFFLTPIRHYVGAAWYHRQVYVPKAWKDQRITLFLERAHIETKVYVNGHEAGQQMSLSTPHRYDVTKYIRLGEKNDISIRVYNGIENVCVGQDSHSVTDQTQGNWNGIIGRLELQAQWDKVNIKHVSIVPSAANRSVQVKVELGDHIAPVRVLPLNDYFVRVTVKPMNSPHAVYTSSLEADGRKRTFDIYLGDKAQLWDEFAPNLYQLTVEAGDDVYETVFGLRDIAVEGRQLLLNGRPLFLRGTVENCCFPLTGYPPTDEQEWLSIFKKCKEYGLNHVRFHSYCPSEAAFAAADRTGIYLQVEGPSWPNHGVKLRRGQAIDQYLLDESKRIVDAYGNHPSFIMFSNGNENMGDFELLERITTMTKAYDPRRIYTVTSNFDHPVLPCEDYLCAFDASGEHIRIQNMHDAVAKDTCLDYSRAVENTPVPIISFEVGQYCSYPDVDICEKYTGNILPTNFDAIRKEMKRKGVYDRLNDYVKASGDLAVRLYKEDIEAALRTKGFGGFELLSIADYPGQSTATVGILDVFGKSKGFITPQKWRGFCSEAVPLFKAKRIFKNTETLTAGLDLYDHGKEKISEPLYEVRIYNEGELFYSIDTHEATLDIPLGDIKKSSQLNVEITVKGHKNSWRIYVFAESEKQDKLHIIRTKDELDQVTANGGRAVVGRELFTHAKDGGFIPVFWSPVHFPTPKPCGAIIDKAHPIFKNFPTEKYPDYQWKTLFDNSKNMDLIAFGHEVIPIIEIVPNFVDNTPASPLFEARIGKAELLFCGFDLDCGDVTSDCLKHAIAEYLGL